MNRQIVHAAAAALLLGYFSSATAAQAPAAVAPAPAAADTLRRLAPEITITAADCTATKVGTSVEPSAIGLPVRAVTLSASAWVEAAGNAPAHCRVDGFITPVDTNTTARPINFRVVLPGTWGHRAAQLVVGA